jgi:hypothetical protein
MRPYSGKTGKVHGSGTGSKSGKGGRHQPKSGLFLGMLNSIGKGDPKANAKDLFLKKVQMCSIVYNYGDETKDVKGKVQKVSDCVYSS